MVISRIRRTIQDLTGRSDRRLVACLLGQIAQATEGAQLTSQILANEIEPLDGRRLMSEIEHRGDAHRAALVEELSVTLATPVDREDLFRLSRSVDDVLDNLRDFVREHQLYQAPSHSCLTEAVSAVLYGLGKLHQAVQHLGGDSESMRRDAIDARKAVNGVRRAYQLGMAELFTLDLSVELLKRRELLRRLDIVGLRLGEAVDALADGSMKRSH